MICRAVELSSAAVARLKLKVGSDREPVSFEEKKRDNLLILLRYSYLILSFFP